MNDYQEMQRSVRESVEARIGNIHGIARAFLAEHPRNLQKEKERDQYLAENPDANIKIDIERLKAIIPFYEFKCHPNCSVASGRAIKGSDIDVGLVVTEQEITSSKQQEFVDELKQQGFTVYSEQEFQTDKKEYEDATDLAQKKNLQQRIDKKASQVIQFATREFLQKRVASQNFSENTIQLVIYLEGRKIA